MNKYFDKNRLSDIDRAFITQLAYGTVRWKLTIDRVITAHSDIKIEKLSAWILNILRIGTYQLLYMTKVPQSAACNESVSLARRYGHKASAGFVNAVLRSIARDGGGAALPSKESNLAGRLSVMHSYPEWLVEKYIALFGAEFTEGLLSAGNVTPELTVRTNTLKTDKAGLIEMLKAEGAEAVSGKYAAEAVILKTPVSVSKLKSYQRGLFQVQDESSMLPAAVLAPKPGDTILDACSAPGGKATHLAQLMQNKGIILARDIYEHKIRLVDEAAARLGIGIIKSEIYDSAAPDIKHESSFDGVLLDAPCTGLGIVRRKPDIKWARELKDTESITLLQKRLLYAVSRSVKPGGSLVYSTCTILPEENEEIVRNFIDNNADFKGDDIAPFLPEALAEHAKGCTLQLYPNRDGTDGFFIARMKRSGG